MGFGPNQSPARGLLNTIGVCLETEETFEHVWFLDDCPQQLQVGSLNTNMPKSLTGQLLLLQECPLLSSN